MAFMAVIMDLGLLFDILLGFRYSSCRSYLPLGSWDCPTLWEEGLDSEEYGLGFRV